MDHHQAVDLLHGQIYTRGVNYDNRGIMSRYQHTKGQIKDNAIEALLHDPLFRQRIEKNKKGKGSYLRKGKHGNRGNWEASGKKVIHFFTTGLLVSVSA